MPRRSLSPRVSLCAATLAIASVTACRSATPTPTTTAVDPAAASAAADTCQPASEEAVSVDNAFGTLHGTMLLPEGCPPYDVVLMHVGSGPTDRDGNSPMLPGSNNGLRLLAESLQAQGIASVRYDKRGIAGSAGSSPPTTEVRFEHFADDLRLWMDMLRGDDRFGALTLVGHSEGALIASVASKASAPDRLVSLSGAGRPAGDVLREQLTNNLPPPMLEQALHILDTLEKGETVDDVTGPLVNVFNPDVQPYIISWMRHDPAKILGELSVPTMIIGGTSDIQIPVAEAELMAAARPDAELCIVEGMNHVLKEATLDPQSQSKAYSDPEVPLSSGVVECIARFVKSE